MTFVDEIPRVDHAFDEGAQLDAWELCAWAREPFESRLQAAVAEYGGDLAGSLARVVAAGGKRLRPAVTMTVAQAAGGSSAAARALESAVAVELLHSATLVHDDLIDGASVRRGVPTLNAREGIGAAVVGGDVLLAAAGLVAGASSPEAATVIGQTLLVLCRGEVAQAGLRWNAAVTAEQILRVIEGKSGSLLRAACLLGAQAAGADAATQRALADYGMQFGVCLQLIDDLLDVASTAGLAGKPVGGDYLSGTVTLPALYAMRTHPELAGWLNPELSQRNAERALGMLRTPQAIGLTVTAAIEHADRAAAALRSVAGSASGDAFANLAAWPRRFIRCQLATKLDPALQHLVRLPEPAW